MAASVSFQDQLPNKLVSTKMYQYRPDRGWKHISARRNAEQSDHPSSLALVTWNIDFQSPHLKERMTAALRHLETYVFKCDDGQEPVACCIMFQEVHKDALPHLLADDWVRRHFVVTPVSAAKWPMQLYGNVTLVSRTIAVTRASIMTFGYSNMGRGAVVVDVKVTTPRADNPREMTLRLINTHLESLPQGARMRPQQLAVLASLLRRKEEVRGGVIAGDMNAIGTSDKDLPQELGLADAWTFPSEHPSGFTWGFQDSCEFPPGRLDKILYVERKAYKIDSPKRIGVGLKASDETGASVAWASDHYGLLTYLRVRG
ncbi:putative endonuclease/Exonuclease/phosphatase family protein [Lyophyllum shimeji]|uniref:Endonuclease/Exonuclease/phosphatase family protein n=1 Tax=Lyophyllum shimeji TaxID=47721 RepID=A0A9P3PSC4_LYOSH|nr:putative endonuclease/Exonuclease/phosphatase family protein [Lyophyllum shimeji]